MKIENKHFLIIIEKKKVEKTSTKRNTLLIGVISLLILTLGISGGIFFFSQNKRPSDEIINTVTDEQKNKTEEEFDEKVEGTYVTSSYLASSAKDKYKEEELYGYTYGEPIKGLKRDETIDLEMSFDTTEIEYWNEIFAIYQDPELTQELTPNNEYDEEKGVVHINPPTYTDGNISTLGLSTDEVTKYSHSEHKLFDKNDGSDWGNIGTLYLAKYRDFKTGEVLEKPEVCIITLEGEVTSNPQITFSITEDGRAKLHWSKVEGATDYYICTIPYYEDKGLDGNAWPIGVTSETEWVYESPDFDTYSLANKDFKYFDVSEEDWYDEYSSKRAEENYGITEGAYKDTSVWGENYLCVVAVNENGTSMISNTYPFSEITANLPYSYASNKAKENGFKNSGYDSVDEVSAYGYVTMCDGYTATKLIDYQTDKAEIVTERYIETDEEGNYVEGVNVPVLKIPYIIEGTPFEYVAEVVDYDEQFLEKDLKFLEEREEKLRKKAGDIEVLKDIQMGAEEELENAVEAIEVREVNNVSITANCALSEYLAMNMLGHNVLIDLSEFPEAADPAFVDDAWLEAYYQNPMMLGVKGYKLNKKGTAMKVVYDEDAVATAKKQEELIGRVSEITAKIITPGMSELEKELAINQYLCDTITYDEDALANAETHSYRYVDEEFNDSFTAYGALINGKCVCAGYAAAFKLLADEAGLNSVVVTGILEGSLSHAWNKVQIDGEWEIVDSTNNDNEYLFNALLNLPDYAGDRILVEDSSYAVDKYLKKYDATKEENEYYRISNKYFPYQEISTQLAAELKENKTAMLRTEYDLNDERFGQITDGVYEELGENSDLYGFYWMGVIYLQLGE